MTPDPALVALARKIALSLNLCDWLVCGVIDQESAWDTWSIRYEPEFLARYVAPLELDVTSATARSMSWGLMQIMGQTARELGYAEQLPKLCDPETGLYWGCRLFQEKMEEAKLNPQTALLLWNGGANVNYPGQVIQKAMRYKP